MNLVSWNIRGLSSGLKEKNSKSVVESHNVEMIVFARCLSLKLSRDDG